MVARLFPEIQGRPRMPGTSVRLELPLMLLMLPGSNLRTGGRSLPEEAILILEDIQLIYILPVQPLKKRTVLMGIGQEWFFMKAVDGWKPGEMAGTM